MTIKHILNKPLITDVYNMYINIYIYISVCAGNRHVVLLLSTVDSTVEV